MSDAAAWVLAKSTGVPDTSREMFDGYAKAGILLDEVSIGRPEDLTTDFPTIATWAKNAGVGLWSVHLPFYPFSLIDPSSLEREKREATLRLHSEYLAKASEVGIRIAVVHPSAEPNSDQTRGEQLKVAADTLARLADIAEGYGMTVAVEDLPRTCIGNSSDEIKRLTADNDKLRVCLDTNHLLTERNADFIRALGDKIVTLHVSDYDFLNERHWLPFEGKNDWREIVSALEDVGYNGPFLYELGLDAPDTIERRPLTYGDFRENYLACVSKRQGKAIGNPKPEVCLAKSFYQKPIIR